MKMNSQKPKLSIVLLTYNHEQYIADALDSILMQKVNFDYEVIIADDFSNDKTRDIILSYKDKFQDIKLLFAKKRYGNAKAGGKFAVINGLNHVRGEYFSILEGDDYYTDETKLQRQIDFLDANPDYIGCGHNTEMLFERSNQRSLFFEENSIKKTHILASDSIDGNQLASAHLYMHTTSKVWRALKPHTYPQQQRYGTTNDWFLTLCFLAFGKIYYIDRVMSCYRLTGKGMESSLQKYEHRLKDCRATICYNHILDYQYNKIFMKFVAKLAMRGINEAPIGWKKISFISIFAVLIFFAIGNLITRQHLKLKVLRKIVLKHWLQKTDRLSLKEKIIILSLKIFFAFWQLLIWLKIYPLIMRVLIFLFNIVYIHPKIRDITFWKFRWYQIWKIDFYDKKFL